MNAEDSKYQTLEGSGEGESANKLVVEARVKGADMHWARAHVDPMLALRNVVCSDRWAEAWLQIVTELRAQQQRKRRARHQPPAPTVRPLPPKLTLAEGAPPELPVAAAPAPTVEQTAKPHRPPRDHPWRNFLLNRERFRPPSSFTTPKS